MVKQSEYQKQTKIMTGLNESENIDDLVFLHRNKSYGAYMLRKMYDRHMTYGIFLAVGLILLFLLFYFIKNNKSEQEDKKIDFRDQITDVVLAEPTLDAPPPSINKSTPAPVIPEVEPPKNVEQVKVVEDITPPIPEKPKEDPKPLQEVQANPTPTSNPLESTSNGKSEGPETVPGAKPSGGDIVTRPQFMAEFPGGRTALTMYLSQNIVYPASARAQKITGTVTLKFVVLKDGSIANIEIYKGISKECDEEAIRIVKMMPKWKPASVNGSPVATRFNLPITFNLLK